MHTRITLRRPFCRMMGFLLLVLLITGCNRSVQQPAESAAATEPESSAVESLLRSNADYQKWFRFYVRHSSYVYPGDATVYRELRRLGYLNIEADNLENRQLPASKSFMIVSLTDRGNALPGLEAGHDSWGVPIAQQQIVSITPAGQGPPPDRLYRYNVVYKWEPTQLGSEIAMELAAKSKPPSGLIQTEVHVRRGTSGLVVIGHPMRGVPVQP
ncbi:MAG: hypothetical protein WBB89_05885 [Candidatus Acidiferrum sp.]